MRQEVINKKTKRLLATLVRSSLVNNFYLAGGTALALQLGHRKSIDLDWFNQKSFNTDKFKKDLAKIGKIIIKSEEKDTLNLSLAGVKLSFLGYPYKLFFPLLSWQGIKIADYRDIACMKLDAVSSRGSKKDFIDLYFILQIISFNELQNLFNKKYKNIDYSKLHILKSLIYFVDADKEPMPIMLKKISWQEVKDYFKTTVKERIIES
ncbi:nucleotidyl transferase AbiEii/AbiGii toxin family protein [Candidatus Parcubacteria bacterium]|nr:nucleotidyl transferase AbiEii/AbiGii toxin family protein [Candidatus Parcubacteria bacterium]